VLAPARVAEGGRVKGIEPSAAIGVGRFVNVFLPTLTLCHPMPTFDLRPLDLDARVDPHQLAVGGMCERRLGPFFLPSMLLTPFES
jgi:hypothetical protein